ncbi:MAG: hypothetical protein HOI80_04190 [Alphaproteobacteria bacterium]|nr:hypothetical protein [Alphaproteobacteria bacterium]
MNVCNRRQCKEAKRPDTLRPKGTTARYEDLRAPSSRPYELSVDRTNLTHSVFLAEHDNPVQLPSLVGQQIVSEAYGCAGVGGQKKRTLPCNGEDTGSNVTRRESEPTSDWSLIARELGEP